MSKTFLLHLRLVLFCLYVTLVGGPEPTGSGSAGKNVTAPNAWSCDNVTFICCVN